MIKNNFVRTDNRPMKIPVCLLLGLLLLASCESNHSAYEYRSISPALNRKPVSKIEKAWVARHQYDHERRLLIPKLGGARWGAVQEYKENGTMEFKDWWERDVKIEDLEASPSTVLTMPKAKEGKNILPQLGFDRQILPSDQSTPSSLPEPFPATGFPEPSGIPPIPGGDTPFPALPPPDGLPPVDPGIPSLPPPLESNPIESGPSPFAPLPGSLPGELPDLAPPGDLPPPDGLPEPGGLPPMEEGQVEEANPFPALPPDPFEKLP